MKILIILALMLTVRSVCGQQIQCTVEATDPVVKLHCVDDAESIPTFDYEVPARHTWFLTLNPLRDGVSTVTLEVTKRHLCLIDLQPQGGLVRDPANDSDETTNCVKWVMKKRRR